MKQVFYAHFISVECFPLKFIQASNFLKILKFFWFRNEIHDKLVARDEQMGK